MEDLSDIDLRLQKALYEFIDPALLTSPSQPAADAGINKNLYFPPFSTESCSILPFSSDSTLTQELQPAPEVAVSVDPDVITSAQQQPDHSRPPRRCSIQAKDIARSTPLLEWFDSHRDWPYPSNDEMLHLADVSGKTLKHTRDWFTNRRARMKQSQERTQSSQSDHGVPISSTSSSSALGAEWSAAEQHILALDQGIQYCTNSTPPAGDFAVGLTEGTFSYQSEVDTISGAERPQSQLFPPDSSTFGTTLFRQPGRKGKRRISITSFASIQAPSQSPSPSKPFPCTFPLLCGKSFKDSHDWKRHEATHLPEMWICMPDGNPPVAYDRCAFCGLYDPRMSHFKTHYNIKDCLNNSLTARSFARKDQLRNHINRIHLKRKDDSGNGSPRFKIPSGPDLLEGWYREPTDLAVQYPAALWCGFCQTKFPTWVERVDHVGAHFQRGENLSTWTHLS